MRQFKRNSSFRIYRLPKRFFRRLFIFFSLLIFLLASGLFTKSIPTQSIIALASSANLGIINVAEHNFQEVLDSSIPMMSLTHQGSQKVAGEDILVGAFNTLVGIELGKPVTFLQAEIPYLNNVSYQVATAEPEEIAPVEKKPPEEKKEIVEDAEEENQNQNQNQVSNSPLIAIYHTHIGEAYALSDGTARIKGGRGGVYLAGKELKRVLEEKHGIGVIHSDEIHDYDYTKVYPYSASEKTAGKILADNPSIEILIDLHRDAVNQGWSRQQSVKEINGEKYATMFLVVGSDRRLSHPEWRQNYEFAQRISAKVEEMYPGLLRKQAQVQDGRYNQQLHPRAILVEIGEANYNYTEEAIRTARAFADVLAEVLKEMEEE